LTSA
jgi:hypothetical protein